MKSDLIRVLIRKKTPIVLNDFSRNRPVSKVFGFDRGTPVDRYYIEKFLGENRGLIKGRVLEIGDSRYSTMFGSGRAESFDVLHAEHGNSGATITGDLTNKATLPENSFDCFICTQTFNFIYEVRKAVEGAHHLLRAGGVMLATVAGISQISRYDMDRWGDYWRFTTASARKLLEDCFTGGVQISCYGNVLAATAFLQGAVCEDLPSPALLDDHDPDYQVLIGIVARKAGSPC